MSDHSSIEWTEATWNPVRGCSIVSKGCTNCYAMKQAHRFSGSGKAYAGLTRLTKGGPVWTGKIVAVPQLLNAPKQWARGRRIFVNSMSDLFHEDLSVDFIAHVFEVMAECPQHVFQVLTKRADRMLKLLTHDLPFEGPKWPLPNVWLGVSVEDQAAADERIQLLLKTPAAVRWISAEPLLGPLHVRNFHQQRACDRCTQGVMDAGNDHLHGRCGCACHAGQPRIDWVVAGGESGPGARPMHPDWARGLRDQCAGMRVPFFFKQWGTWFYEGEGATPTLGRTCFFPDLGARFSRWSKRNTGRELDGRTHDEYPQVQQKEPA